MGSTNVRVDEYLVDEFTGRWIFVAPFQEDGSLTDDFQADSSQADNLQAHNSSADNLKADSSQADDGS
jgi:Zn/Cd-binding protein ZinT